MDKAQVAADISDVVGGYRTYSGTKKWWRGVYEGFKWTIHLDTGDDYLIVKVTPRPELPSEDRVLKFQAKESSFEHSGGTVSYDSASEFVDEVIDLAKTELEEKVFREIVKQNIKSIISDGKNT